MKFRRACTFILERAAAARPGGSVERPAVRAVPSSAVDGNARDQVLEALERLGQLRSKGVITEEEFRLKKQQRLTRL
jgi:Short C-terminal domain